MPKAKIKYKEELYTFDELSEMTGIKASTLYRRVVTDRWPIDEAIETPVIPNGSGRSIKKGQKGLSIGEVNASNARKLAEQEKIIKENRGFATCFGRINSK